MADRTESVADKMAAGRVRVSSKFLFDAGGKFFVRGVTYGPFRPRGDGHHLPNEPGIREDFRLMREAGVNTLRLYHLPPRDFLDLCAEYGLRVLATLPWMQHVEFLNNDRARNRIVESVEKAVGTHAGHPAVLGYLVGNEIPSTMVRWLGVARVTEFVEHLIAKARTVDPDALYSYATYPPTEYLIPSNADFVTFNVYLHRQEDFDRYLARLQNLAGERPLLMGEFGMDTIRHTEDEQAEMIGWHLESVVRGGLAGTILFAWTDEWFTGGEEVTDWAFGLVDRDRHPKTAYHRVRSIFGGDGPVTTAVGLPHYPKVSVIVCSYNGAATVADCLDALGKLDYPDYEVVFVDDGSTDHTRRILEDFPDVVKVHQPNMGLSVARNTGAAAATGEILAYTDSDCMPDRDWLFFMVNTLLSGDYAGVGGPNIPPPATNWIQACVAAAPGGPSHVLTTDTVAEHIPGCNMAFHRWAFDRVGGFDARYRKAGDDVDFCWRIQQEGGVIAYSPAAVVWHYRRFTLKAYIRQQTGYGEAESLLRFKHLVFFGPTGNAKWKGRVYGQTGFAFLPSRAMVYHGVFGSGLFQPMYHVQESELSAYLRSIEWLALTVFIFLLSIPIVELRVVPALMFGGTFFMNLSYMLNCRIQQEYDTVPSRLLVTLLAFLQPLARGWKRYLTWLMVKRTPVRVINRPATPYQPGAFERSRSRLAFWNENGTGREQLIGETVRMLEEEGWSYSLDTGWQNWDLQVYGSFWWVVRIATVTEYHGGPKCLTRARLSCRPVATTILLNLLALPILLYRQAFTTLDDPWLWLAYGATLAWIGIRALRLKRRIARLLETAARHSGVATTPAAGVDAPETDSARKT